MSLLAMSTPPPRNLHPLPLPSQSLLHKQLHPSSSLPPPNSLHLLLLLINFNPLLKCFVTILKYTITIY